MTARRRRVQGFTIPKSKRRIEFLRLAGTMEWLLLAGAVLIGFFVGSLRGRPAHQAPMLNQLALNMASDRELMLFTFRRELANHMVRADPDRFLRLYRKARAAEAAIGSADKAEREAQFTIITKKYPMYEDFNLVGTREHVLYADALSTYPLEDIEDHYLNLVKFHALQRMLDEGWWLRGAATSDRDLEHLEQYVRKIKDTKFRQRLIAAIDEFQTFASAKQLSRLDEPGKSPYVYETNVLAVRDVPHFAESRTGFHFIDTNEFALYGVFLPTIATSHTEAIIAPITNSRRKSTSTTYTSMSTSNLTRLGRRCKSR